MYRLQLAEDEESMLDFESRQLDILGHERKVEAPKGMFANEMSKGQLLAFKCFDEDQVVGGMIVGVQGENMMIHRLFVEKPEQGKGAGSFMVRYVKDNQVFFEDYYGQGIQGIVIEPLKGSVTSYAGKQPVQQQKH